jgi:acetyl esterase/lipase
MRTLHLFILVAGILLFAACDPNNTPQPSPNPTVELTDTIMKDVSYGPAPKQKMDIYLPEDRSAATKVVVLVHGGAWHLGDKSEMNPLIPKLQREWPEAAIVNINYRLANGTDIIHTQISDDLKKAIKYIADNKTSLNVSDTMYLIGASAGAQLSLLYAYKFNEAGYVKAVSNLFGPSYFTDWELYSSYNLLLGGPVKDIWIKYTGSAWDTALYNSLSPYHLATASTVIPTISFHGSLDPIVPVYHSRWFHAKLGTLGVRQDYKEYDGEFHGFSDGNYDDCVRRSVAFFKEP